MLHITVEMAADIIGKSPQFVRIGLQQGTLPIGCAVKMSSMYSYSISPALLASYTGFTMEALERKVQEWMM